MTLPSIILCLSTEKGLAVAQSLSNLVDRAKFTVCTFREVGTECFEERIRDTAIRSGASHLYQKQWRDQALEVVRKTNASMIICVGWRYLISDEVCDLVNGNVVVAHDSLLPKFRGFAPLPTALIEGEDRTGVTFLKATAGVDSGPIYWQDSFPISSSDTIGTLIQKTLPIYVEGVRKAVFKEFAAPQPQIDSMATYSVWRNEDDYWIDWTQFAEVIERTIRALGPPYSGARTIAEGRPIAILSAKIEEDVKFAIRQPGKIWDVDEAGRPAVICGRGILRLYAARYIDGEQEPFIPLNKLRIRFGDR